MLVEAASGAVTALVIIGSDRLGAAVAGVVALEVGAVEAVVDVGAPGADVAGTGVAGAGVAVTTMTRSVGVGGCGVAVTTITLSAGAGPAEAVLEQPYRPTSATANKRK